MPSLAWFFPVFQGFLLGMLAMALHEAGHMVAALATGVKIKSIRIRWKGLAVVREAGSSSKNLMITLAGPFTNLALMLFWPWSHLFGLANLCFAFINLLPLEGSDGDRVMRCWTQMRRESFTLPSFRRVRKSASATLISVSKGTSSVIPVAQGGD